MTDTMRIHDPGENALAPTLQRIPLAVRIVVYLIAFLFVMLVAFPAAFYAIDYFVPAVHVEIGVWRWAGVAFFALSLIAYIVVSLQLMTRGKGPFTEFDPPKELVIEGPYRYSRNPVVATLMGTILGLAIAMSSTGILLMFVLFCLLGQWQVTRLEEPLLKQRYGQSYVDYCARVPRWVPRLFRSR